MDASDDQRFPCHSNLYSLCSEVYLQRLFTMFAGGWPGFGMLIQRLAVGIALLHDEKVPLNAMPITPHIAAQVLGTALSALVIMGLWTPLTSGLIAAIEFWIALTHPGYAETATLLAILSATLAMIGPGAFSIDARLFGRKNIGH